MNSSSFSLGQVAPHICPNILYTPSIVKIYAIHLIDNACRIN